MTVQSAMKDLNVTTLVKPGAEEIGDVAPELSGMLRVLTCGSVDDGKSTLIGRLLWDATDLFDDQRATLERGFFAVDGRSGRGT
jgi:GTPase